MAILSVIKDMIADPAGYLPIVQEKGQHVLDLVKSHPWTSLGVATGTALLWSYVRAPRNLPPGPLNYPLVGATSCFSDVDLGKKMLQWRPKYGEIISFYKMGQLYIVLNSERTIREAFVKRQEQFSHRAEEFVFEVVGLKDDIFQAPYNETWKKNKKFAVSSLKTHGFGTPKSEGKIHDQLAYLEEFLLNSNGSPLDIVNEIKSMCAALITSIVLGGDPSWKDPNVTELVRLANDWIENLSDCSVLPFRNESPKLAEILGRKAVKKYKVSNENLRAFLIRRIKDHAKDLSDREPSDVVDAYLKERGTNDQAIKTMADTILIFLPDATDTSALVDHWLLFYMTFYPAIQKKLQGEVDSVCGPNRRPTLADRAEMHYTQAVIHEALRHINVFTMSGERELRESITLDGYNFPKGAHVMGNFYGVHYDPEIFSNPEKYDPSRFIKEDGTFNTSLATKCLTFSLGSRKCIGEPFFKVTSFLFLTRMLQRFDLEFDPSSPRPSTEQDKSSIVAKPDNFKVCFKPR